MTEDLFRRIMIRNYKSIESESIELGRVNVFIGENGAGKSNVLEAIAFAGAAAANKVDNEFLTARGMRVTSTKLMRSVFKQETNELPIDIKVCDDDSKGSPNAIRYTIKNDRESYPTWGFTVNYSSSDGKFNAIQPAMAEISKDTIKTILEEYNKGGNASVKRTISDEVAAKVLENTLKALAPDQTSIRPESLHPDNGEGISDFSTTKELDKMKSKLCNFIIYSPENSSLRLLRSEGQILPLGVNGEGLLKFLSFLNCQKDRGEINDVRDGLNLFSWFSDMSVPLGDSEIPLKIYDKYLHNNEVFYDQRSASEGFLFVAFYMALFSSRLTPDFFAVDNIDASLNPKLCQELMRRLCSLAKKNQKQAIFTTHNPAILDGLDISDPEQRLFVVSRNRVGHTVVRRFNKKLDYERKRLSELFIHGLLGGVPKGF